MDIKNIAELLGKNIDKVLSKDGIEHVLNMSKNTSRFDAINRILIYLQDKNAFDIKTIDEWEILGRDVSNSANRIYGIIPLYEFKYTMKDSDEEADISDLNPTEKLKALSLGILTRKEIIQDIKVITLYDIRQTTNNIDETYEVTKPILDSQELLRLFTKITMGTITFCDDFYYSDSNNELFIPKKEYNTLAYLLAQALCKFYSNKYEIRTDRDKYYIEYAITTLFRGDTSKIYMKVPDDINEYIQILGIVDEIMENIIRNMNFKGKENNISGAEKNINMLKKAKVILDIFNANNINKKLTGS